MEASHSNNLIQLADMVCGSVARSCGHEDDRFRRLIGPRERFVQTWRNQKVNPPTYPFRERRP